MTEDVHPADAIGSEYPNSAIDSAHFCRRCNTRLGLLSVQTTDPLQVTCRRPPDDTEAERRAHLRGLLDAYRAEQAIATDLEVDRVRLDVHIARARERRDEAWQHVNDFLTGES